jgi:hypothetical protein
MVQRITLHDGQCLQSSGRMHSPDVHTSRTASRGLTDAGSTVTNGNDVILSPIRSYTASGSRGSTARLTASQFTLLIQQLYEDCKRVWKTAANRRKTRDQNVENKRLVAVFYYHFADAATMVFGRSNTKGGWQGR